MPFESVGACRKALLLVTVLVAAVLIAASLAILLALMLRSAADNGSESSYRLPTDVKPVSYALTLAPFIYSSNPGDCYFTGSVSIAVEAVNDTDMFKLHSVRLEVPTVRLRNSTGGDVIVDKIEENVEKQWLTIKLGEPLRAGETYTVLIDRFKGKFVKNGKTGLYLSSSYSENSTEYYLVSSQLEPIHAREVFPCFDEPAMKAEFNVSLVRGREFTALSNMPIKSSSSVPGNTWFSNSVEPKVVIKDDFETTPTMSTYTLAFLVAKFESISHSDSKGRVFTNWLSPELVKKSNFTLSVAAKAIEAFEKLLNVSYKTNITKQAGVPLLNFEAMENWGLIIYQQNILMYNENTTTTLSKLTNALTVSHEIVHQWFGNLVTMKWWNEIWLNEAFSTFYSYLGLEWGSESDLDSHFVMFQKYLFEMNFERKRYKVHPIQVDVSTPTDIDGIFDYIVYQKGASVVRMMHNSIGARVFGAAVSSYIRKHSYSNAGSEDFYSSLNEQLRIHKQSLDAETVMSSWVKQVGYPLVTCSMENGSLLLRQQDIVSLSHKEKSNLTWSIPITAMTNLNHTGWSRSEVAHLVHWMRGETLRLPLDSSTGWYLINLRSSGHYQVNYDRENWDRLAAQLTTDHTVFTPADRASLIYDSFTLASLGIIDYSVPVRIVMGYLKNETEFAPWAVVLRMQRMYKKDFSALSQANVVEGLLENVFEYVTAGTQQNSSLTGLLAQLIVSTACNKNVTYCIRFALKECQKFIDSNSTHSTSADFRYSVLRTCVKHDEGEFKPWQLKWFRSEARKLLLS
ncbi:hypothetical protein BOX15_Mlig018792g3 [Macrostomum lignano]|uniref:Aminopeptidase n=1 Tax=Macrostomum lignano TaxID=282301 RepID=A0A267G9L5_9PLAT|nr:hypothetical protein BOX15_Mlig018792g3 [Macrostomum lignano]